MVKQNACMPSQTSADCPAECWIQFHVVDENGRPVSGVRAVFIDSAKQKHNINFSGQPVILNSVKPGKGKMVFSSDNLYKKSLSELKTQESASSSQDQAKYRKEPPTEKKISWRGKLMTDVSDPTKDGREIGDLTTKNSYKFILETIYLEELIIVGAQYDESAGNKLMFAGQAVRALHQSNASSKVVLMFSQRYTAEQITLVKNTVEAAGATFLEITTLQECLDYINNKNGDDRWKYPILSLRFYSHGLVSQIFFGYNIDGSLNLTLQNFTGIRSSSFSPSPSTAVYSYACRTGLGPAGDSGDERHKKITEDRDNSLAQKMANHLQIPVWAYIRRSEYGYTWGTRLYRYTPFGQAGQHMDERNKSVKAVGAIFFGTGAVNDVEVGDSNSYHTDDYVKFSPK